MRTTLVVAACLVALYCSACATYLDDLNRAERHYVASEHERALALFRILESDVDSLSHADRTRYAYLRGINDYRLGKEFRPDARHWLAVARALEREKPGGLRAEWQDRLDEALKDLNQDVYGVGVFPDEPGNEEQPTNDALEELETGSPGADEPASASEPDEIPPSD